VGCSARRSHDRRARLDENLGVQHGFDADGRVQQFAVWTITNNPKRNGYVGLTSGFSVFGSGPDDEEIDAIRHLFDMADIDMGKYRALR